MVALCDSALLHLVLRCPSTSLVHFLYALDSTQQTTAIEILGAAHPFGIRQIASELIAHWQPSWTQTETKYTLPIAHYS